MGEDDDQVWSEVSEPSNTYIPFDTQINRLTSNETSNLVKPITNLIEAENQQIISNETPNINTPTNNLPETENQFLTSN